MSTPFFIRQKMGQFGYAPVKEEGPFNIPPEKDKTLLKVIEYKTYNKLKHNLAKAVGALQKISQIANKGDGTTTECEMCYTADDCLIELGEEEI